MGKMVTLSKDAIYAYATFKGVVKEVYEILSWCNWNSRIFCKFNSERLAKARWEFVGRKALKNSIFICGKYYEKL